MTGRQTLVYNAKKKLTSLYVKYAIKTDHGMNTECLEHEIDRIEGLVNVIERYVEDTCDYKLVDGKLRFNGENVILSEKNNYFCGQEPSVEDVYFNCLSHEEICKIAKELNLLIK